MSETKFTRCRIDMAVMQSKMSILDDDRKKCLQAINAMKIAEDMCKLLEDIKQSGGYLYMEDDINNLLTESRGEL